MCIIFILQVNYLTMLKSKTDCCNRLTYVETVDFRSLIMYMQYCRLDVLYYVLSSDNW